MAAVGIATRAGAGMTRPSVAGAVRMPGVGLEPTRPRGQPGLNRPRIANFATRAGRRSVGQIAARLAGSVRGRAGAPP